MSDSIALHLSGQQTDSVLLYLQGQRIEEALKDLLSAVNAGRAENVASLTDANRLLGEINAATNELAEDDIAQMAKIEELRALLEQNGIDQGLLDSLVTDMTASRDRLRGIASAFPVAGSGEAPQTPGDTPLPDETAEEAPAEETPPVDEAPAEEPAPEPTPEVPTDDGGAEPVEPTPDQ